MFESGPALKKVKEAELDNVFGESDGRQSDGTDRKAETTAAMADLGQTDTAQRELASLREGVIQEDDGREGSKATGELVQPAYVRRPLRCKKNQITPPNY